MKHMKIGMRLALGFGAVILLGDFRKRSCYVRVGMFRWSTRNVNSGAIREVLSCACQTLHGQAVHRSVRRKPPIYA